VFVDLKQEGSATNSQYKNTISSSAAQQKVEI